MSAPPPGSHMEWHPPSGPPYPPAPPYGPPPASPYDAPYHPRGPPMTPYPLPPYSTPRMPPPPHKYWYHHSEGPPRRGPYGGGAPYPPPPHYEEPRHPPHGRSSGGYDHARPYGPPPPPEYYPPRSTEGGGYPPAFRTPQRGTAALVPTSSSFSSKEEDVPPPHRSSDWEPTRPTIEPRKKQDPKKQGGGDPLSFLAKVAMAPPQEKAAKGGVQTHIAPPTDHSPSRLRSSPIITPHSVPPREPPPQYYREPPPYHHPPPHGATPKPITPTTTHYGPRPSAYDDARGPYYTPPYSSSSYPHPSGYDSRAASWEQPAVVVEERSSSYDSLESATPPLYPPRPPPAWASPYAAPPPGWYPHYESSPYAANVGSRGRPYYDDRAYPPRGPPHYGPPPPPPRDEKTILRKKFSWKHFPELERFLVDNRDDYLKHSSRNYTIEQKQFNNALTERLIALAEQHGYIFDPEDFNFVAIRDRIRCYYKSYVQTARKRGLLLPSTTTGVVPDDAVVAAAQDDDENDEDMPEEEEEAAPPAEAEVRE